MEHEIHITLRHHLAIGKVTLNEIVYQLQEIRNPLMLEILTRILRDRKQPQLSPPDASLVVIFDW